ncbi:MAG: succinate CoA transferase [Bacillota bacterium]
MEERILCEELKAKIMSAEDAALLLKDGMTVAVSGFTLSSYPKAVPVALAKRVENGEKIKLSLYSGASTGDELDGIWADNGILNRRLPYQTNRKVRAATNRGELNFSDIHLGVFPQNLMYGFYKKPDIAIVEAVGITKEGNIIPANSVGIIPQAVTLADQVIIEINAENSMDYYGLHDVAMLPNPPHRGVIPILNVRDRIGKPYVDCPKEKIAAIVFTDQPDGHRKAIPITETYAKMADHLLDFFDFEVKKGRLPENLLPLQSGVGTVSNAVLEGMRKSDFENLEFFTEVIQESVLNLIDDGKVAYASGTSVSPTPDGMIRFQKDVNRYKDYIVLRPQEISNHVELVRRLGVIAINTPLEIDIYGNVNSTHQFGSGIMNGIGGSGDFAHNGYYSIFATPSTAKDGAISSVVPMVSHVDHTEHDTTVFVTEYGYADLRGLSPKERAEVIIEKCAHPDYKEMLRDYVRRAAQSSKLQTPHLLKEALSWHQRFLDTGSMLPDE